MPRPAAERPTAEQVADILAQAGLTPHAAAKLIKVSPRTLQRAMPGVKKPLTLHAHTWRLLRVMLSQAARDEMPEARIRREETT